MSEMREKESLECGRMHIRPLKTQKLPGPLSRGPWPQIAHFAHVTLLCYIGNFRPQKLGPHDKILDPQLTFTVFTVWVDFFAQSTLSPPPRHYRTFGYPCAVTCIHNAILFIDTSNNNSNKQAHWLVEMPYLSIKASNDLH